MKLTMLLAGLSLSIVASTSVLAGTAKPTIVLVHGAFADSSSWNGVTRILESDGYTVIAAANPLRSLKADAQPIADLLQSLKSPAVVVGHSYGGAVISEAAYGQANVKALVYVAAFAPDSGESAIALSGMFPGSTLGTALAPPVALTSGGNDLYIQQDKFHDQFAADVPSSDAKLMAAAQRPVTDIALNETPTGVAWKTIPSWWVYGGADKNIPPQAMKFMAERAKSRQTVVIEGGSHVVMISNPEAVAQLIETAATAK